MTGDWKKISVLLDVARELLKEKKESGLPDFTFIELQTILFATLFERRNAKLIQEKEYQEPLFDQNIRAVKYAVLEYMFPHKSGIDTITYDEFVKACDKCKPEFKKLAIGEEI